MKQVKDGNMNVNLSIYFRNSGTKRSTASETHQPLLPTPQLFYGAAASLELLLMHTCHLSFQDSCKWCDLSFQVCDLGRGKLQASCVHASLNHLPCKNKKGSCNMIILGSLCLSLYLHLPLHAVTVVVNANETVHRLAPRAVILR